MSNFPLFSRALGFDLRERVSFTARGVQPPASQYIEQGSALLIKSFSAVGARTITLRARILTAAGKVQLLSFDHVTAATFLVREETFPLREGFLLGVVASTPETGLSNAALYVSVALTYSFAGVHTTLQPLFSDYVDTAHFIGWPGGRSILPREGPGNLVTLGETIGGAGAEIVEALPTGVVWRIYSIRVRLITDINAPTRQPRVENRVGATAVRSARAPFVTGASSDHVYMWYDNAREGDFTAGTIKQVPMGSDWWIEAGTLAITAQDLQPGDVLRSYVIREEWIEPFV